MLFRSAIEEHVESEEEILAKIRDGLAAVSHSQAPGRGAVENGRQARPQQVNVRLDVTGAGRLPEQVWSSIPAMGRPGPRHSRRTLIEGCQTAWRPIAKIRTLVVCMDLAESPSRSAKRKRQSPATGDSPFLPIAWRQGVSQRFSMTADFEPKLSILPAPQRRLWDELETVPSEFVLYGGNCACPTSRAPAVRTLRFLQQ